MNVSQPSVKPLLVPKAEEDKYCAQNKMIIRRLPSRATIIGIARDTTDSIYASLNLTFPLPKVPETPELFCTYHLLEHLINPPIRPLAERNDVFLNATTPSYHIIEIATGFLAPKPNKYSLWEIIPALFSRIGSLARDFKSEDYLEGERAAVKSEIVEDHSKQFWLVEEYLSKEVLAETNPIRSYYAATKNTLDAISKENLGTEAPNVFCQNGFISSVVYDGKKSVLQEFLNKIEGNIVLNLGATVKKQSPSYGELDLTSDLPPPQTKAKTGLTNNLISLAAVWLVTSEQYNPNGLALKIIVPFLSEQFFIATRKQGWGYVANVRRLALNQKHLVFFTVNLDKRLFSTLPKPYQAMHDLVNQVLHTSRSEVPAILSRQKLRKESIPTFANERLDCALIGLKEFNAIIDADKLRDAYSNLQESDLNFWLDYFRQTPPTLLAIGDI